MADQYSVSPTPALVGAPAVGAAPLENNQPRLTPFRIATLERAEIMANDSLTVTASEQPKADTIHGSGYIYSFSMKVNVTTSGNSANTAYQEDGPYAASSTVILQDVTGQILNLPGISLKYAARYGGWEPFNLESSSDTNIWQKVTGTGGTGGSFTYHLKVPVAINRRALLGVLGNQDRSQSYQLTRNLGASGSIYSTGPTAAGAYTNEITYNSYTVPNAQSESGIANQVLPPFYGVIPYLLQSQPTNVPTGGSQITHYFQRLGNTIRFMMLILRSNGSRATAESNLPTNIQLKVGNQYIFNESVASRRAKMYDRFGFDAPSGVIVYDMLHDFGPMAGNELGNDWFWTQQVNELSMLITYPSGFGSTNNTLTVVTSDMTIPRGVNVYAI